MPASSHLIQLVFASGPAEVNRKLVERIAAEKPDLPLVVVGEFEPPCGEWIPYHVLRSEQDNLTAVQTALGGRRVERAAIILSSTVPFAKMRRLARAVAPGAVTAYDEDLQPVTFARHILDRTAAALTSPRARKWLRRIVHPTDAEIPLRARLALLRARLPRPPAQEKIATISAPLPDGVTVVIPSRDGKELLAALLPALVPQITCGEIIVSDNGSTDGTAGWLAAAWPTVRVIENSQPLSFARAVNAGIDRAGFRYLLLLNNDMLVEPGFVDALEAAFHRVPDLFCATAQIFPPGIRREETGKAVWRREGPLDFPVRCDEPIPGEDLTWVLYGSGGCSLFDTAKLRAIGGVNELYEPAYVEDMDFGYQAWKRGWPSVFCADARVEHRHRATTSRFYTSHELDVFVEVNYLRFLIHAIGSPALFQELWRDAIRRLQLTEARDALRRVPKIGPQPGPATGALTESEIFALGNGDVAVFPGRTGMTGGTILIVSPYLPYPLSHGGAVRMYNLMYHAAREWNLVLISFCEEMATPAPELLDICHEVVLVRRHGSHYRRDTPRPDAVEEFDSESFRAALKQEIQRWNPGLVQLEFTQMAQYASACGKVKTVLIEHDITFDLHQQLLAAKPGDWELEQQYRKWRNFETAAWSQVDCVVTMSPKDAGTVSGAKYTECLPNGVDTGRFQPPGCDPEPRRLLFIGSFAHLPNVLAIEYFVREVWPLLGPGYRLHIIAGLHPERYPVAVDLKQPGIELEGFVSDVRTAYARAEIVIVPLTASAGTNIKVLEAMAMGRLVVSTPAGVNGLDVTPERDVIVASSATEMASRIRTANWHLFIIPARETGLRYDWKEIARRQSALYRRLIGER